MDGGRYVNRRHAMDPEEKFGFAVSLTEFKTDTAPQLRHGLRNTFTTAKVGGETTQRSFHLVCRSALMITTGHGRSAVDEKNKLAAATGECLSMLDNERPIAAAVRWIAAFEDHLDSMGIPPAQIQFASICERSIDEDGDEAIGDIRLVPSVDISALANGVSNSEQEIVLKHAETMICNMVNCTTAWELLPDLSEIESEERRIEMAAAFKMSIGAVSHIRQWAFHFGPATRGPRIASSEDDMKKLMAETLCQDPRTSDCIMGNSVIRNLVDHLWFE